MFICLFFFKQKTAYEMRICDWSSDVCSSDLWRAPNVMDAPAWARKDFVREPRLARESLANFEHGNGSLRRLSALVLFGHASASKRLSLIFHGQYPIADRQSVHRKRHQTTRALIGPHIQMQVYTPNHPAQAHE